MDVQKCPNLNVQALTGSIGKQKSAMKRERGREHVKNMIAKVEVPIFIAKDRVKLAKYRISRESNKLLN